MVNEEDIVARSIKIEPKGEIHRCTEGSYSAYYCLPVVIYFENGEKREYLLKSHSEPKALQEFLENKKGLRERMEKNFVLLKDGSIRYASYLIAKGSAENSQGVAEPTRGALP